VEFKTKRKEQNIMAVTASDVRLIMNVSVTTLTDAMIIPFLTAAGTMIDEVFTDVSIDATLLEEIEKWFTAHMIASTIHRTTVEEKVGDASVKYNSMKGEGLSSTPYGQMVMILDTAGLMSKLGKKSATIHAVKGFDE
jgi:hypothetical protein